MKRICVTKTINAEISINNECKMHILPSHYFLHETLKEVLQELNFKPLSKELVHAKNIPVELISKRFVYSLKNVLFYILLFL